jgi:hypothetical protein
MEKQKYINLKKYYGCNICVAGLPMTEFKQQLLNAKGVALLISPKLTQMILRLYKSMYLACRMQTREVLELQVGIHSLNIMLY